jgi:hypothetical protein
VSETNGRDRGGRFAAGNLGGPGRPRRDVERAYVDATVAAVPIDAWSEIVSQAVADAKAGDGVARAWLSKVLGIDAPQKVAHTDADGAPLSLATLLAAAHNVVSPPRPETERRPNVVDVDAELARLEREPPTEGREA